MCQEARKPVGLEGGHFRQSSFGLAKTIALLDIRVKSVVQQPGELFEICTARCIITHDRIGAFMKPIVTKDVCKGQNYHVNMAIFIINNFPSLLH